MSTVVFTYDTETKQRNCTIDGTDIGRVESFSYYAPYQVDKMDAKELANSGSCVCITLKTDVAPDVEGHTHVYASEQLQGVDILYSDNAIEEISQYFSQKQKS